jgi:site-specific DNA-methyltransferase (adenine-specific)
VILHGDCREQMAAMEPNSVDAIVTDPPYGLSFMGKDWDKGVPGVAFWEPALRVLKPGGHLLAFGGTRTFHRMAVAIEDAGFEIKDTLSWLYGSGFPKHKSLLKPAWEPIILARKRGASVLNIDACRIGTDDGDRMRPPAKPANVYAQDAWTQNPDNHKPYDPAGKGRWPANVCLDADAAALLDQMSGERKGGAHIRHNTPNGVNKAHSYGRSQEDWQTSGHADTGGASRFFFTAPIDDPDAEHLRFAYVPKASRSERNAGLEGMPERASQKMGDGLRSMVGHPSGGHGSTSSEARRSANHHPTVKPLALMRWLVRLVTPPGGIVLDPFAGSGTTGAAAALEGFGFIGIEQDAEYVEIARRRIEHWKARGVQLEIPA